MIMSGAMASDDVSVSWGAGAGSGPGGGGVLRRVVVGPGSICGRARANFLKHLASLLREKLRAGPCNLVQVATEIHSQFEVKHNTTMRRIYDVVNVCEGAGVLARTGHRSPEWKEKPAANQNVIQRYYPFRRSRKSNLRGGAEIQWLGGTSQNSLGGNVRTPQIPCQNQKLLLEIEKGQIADRIRQKRRLSDALSIQVVTLQKLLEQNQAQCRLYPNSSGSLSTSDAELSMPCSMEQGSSSSEFASVNSKVDLSVSTQAHTVCTDLTSPQSPEEYSDMDDFICDYFVDEQRPCAAKRLHLPFVMLATPPDANVNIFMSGDPSSKVYLELDQNYRLLDHIQVIKMFPEREVNTQQSQPSP